MEGLRDFSQRTRILATTENGLSRPISHRAQRVVLAHQEQFDRAWDILDAYQQATENDRKGAVMFGDEMIDEASRRWLPSS